MDFWITGLLVKITKWKIPFPKYELKMRSRFNLSIVDLTQSISYMRQTQSFLTQLRRLADFKSSLISLILAFSFAFSQGTSVSQHSEVWGAVGDVSSTNENPLTEVHAVTVNAGQPFIGTTNGTQYSADFGIWSVFLKEPDAPIVSATDGAQAHPELIRVSWQKDKLSPPADFSTAIPAGGSQTTGNWVVNKDNEWRANVPADDPAFDDDQSIFPGTLYEYGVRISNEYGYSDEGLDIGFTISNGKIAGRVFTPGPTPGAPWTPVGNPVADVEVSLSPITGKSVIFDGTNDYVSVDADYSDSVTTAFTVEFWYNVDPASDDATILDW